MTADWFPAQTSFDLHGGRILDTAQGILIGLRRCSSETALHELLSAAKRHQMPVFTMAWALVHLASGADADRKSIHSFVGAQSAARHEWGELLAGPAVPAC
ncbi:ANTAR domain-containing protein [Mycobacterium botniense]|uniref:ANTAR domain-containing protein n=1 Tax=Mycobacterium botniense TaxID=84962 RepID=A0A7I9Y1A1_9MYCO|nr:ANTAR domain-containing protein [Mycobacterium botniense]GFG75848.1 ANTAR domain-containing protein [Mycobacterium botniense]